MMAPEDITGRATAANASSQVIISSYFAITLGTNLTADGIDFGNLTSLPTYQQNATLNYVVIAPDAGTDENFTLYNMTVADDSNINIDGCIKANESMKSGASQIGLPNYTWANSTGNNLSFPSITPWNTMTTSDAITASNVAPANDVMYRFWLNVTGSTSPGTYTNTIEFKAVKTGDGC